MANEDIRNAIMKKRLRFWEVAQALGVSAETLSRWLRVEMPEDKREKILNVVKTFEL